MIDEAEMRATVPVRMEEAGGNLSLKGRGKSLGDPNLPRWLCQMCRHPLSSAGVEAFVDKLHGVQGSLHGGSGSVFAASRMDQSFVVLPKAKTSQQGGAGLPPQRAPRPVGLPYPTPGYVPTSSQMNLGVSIPPGSSGHEQHGSRALDESFVVLPSAAASLYKFDSLADSGIGNRGAKMSNMPNSNPASFHSQVNVLQRCFDIASNHAQIDQPLCVECMKGLSEELEKDLDEVNRDIRAYEYCLERLEKQQHDALTDDDFEREKLKIEEEERKLETLIREVNEEREGVEVQLRELELKSEEFEELEERFWHDCNDFRLQLTAHQEERDAVLASMEVATSQLDMLKRTNVLNDAFHIWHDGEFGTINNFRLGRLPTIPVEWDEINAAWGQACLLLHTMAQYCKLNFTYRILPMGSYPRIADIKGTYELFGPVNLFWSSRYDKAMTFFLSCLKEFADFAHAKDRSSNVAVDKCFQLPYKIESDKVEGYTITQSFNRQERWTKALKYTLCNLKWALYWLIGNTAFQAASPASSVALTAGGGSQSQTETRSNLQTQQRGSN